MTQSEAASELARLYREACQVPSDMVEHVPYLWELARSCNTVTEFGTRTGVSTTAFAFAYPAKLTCYDIELHPDALALELLVRSAGVDMRLIQADDLTIEIEETDLLFIDTWHVYEQLRQELKLHSDRVRHFIVMHDTTTYGDHGDGGGLGLWPAIDEFLSESSKWTLAYRTAKCHGLTVLSRRNVPWEEGADG